MAGRSSIEYWFKTQKKKEVLKGEYNYVVAEQIGVTDKYLSNILNRRYPLKHKAVAYAIAKYTNSNYEIIDVFDIIDKKDIH